MGAANNGIVENEQLFSKMTSMVDEVREIQGKVLEIFRLQEIFSEKVLVQVSQPCPTVHDYYDILKSYYFM